MHLELAVNSDWDTLIHKHRCVNDHRSLCELNYRSSRNSFLYSIFTLKCAPFKAMMSFVCWIFSVIVKLLFRDKICIFSKIPFHSFLFSSASHHHCWAGRRTSWPTSSPWIQQCTERCTQHRTENGPKKRIIYYSMLSIELQLAIGCNPVEKLCIHKNA